MKVFSVTFLFLILLALNQSSASALAKDVPSLELTEAVVCPGEVVVCSEPVRSVCMDTFRDCVNGLLDRGNRSTPQSCIDDLFGCVEPLDGWDCVATPNC